MRVLKLIGNLFLLPLYLFSLIVPRNKKLWVMGSWFGNRYSDSSRYVFEYITENEPDIRAIWLTRQKNIVRGLRSKNLEAYSIYSLKGYWYSCRASVAMFTVNITDVNTIGSSKALKFQLWHGIPLKKIVYDDNYNNPINKTGLVRSLSQIKSFLLPFKDVYGKWDAVASTSPLVSNIFKSAFQLPENKIFITGTPRGDIILDKEPDKPSVLKINPLDLPIEKKICYFPTHRNDAKALSDFINSINLSNLPDFLEKHNTILYIKLHYYNLANHTHRIDTPRVVLLNENDESDINYLLPWTDVLITDYSSVYFDYLLLNRPIIFTPFDLNEYMSKDRELYGEYELLTPGSKCNTWNEVTGELTKLFSGNDEHYEIRTKMKEEYHTFSDTRNSERVVGVVKSLLNQ
ncbi:CDP-glycerol glycerophosphotransferase family protein [Paenibacillus sp. M1]|uniref:CDP-glycerol glycerophosphotransferase family protein n=1 Tax=Paenibacillus haidiansis TaxID=1574488 RepID=A0ABU7VWL0_9BACL